MCFANICSALYYKLHIKSTFTFKQLKYSLGSFLKCLGSLGQRLFHCNLQKPHVLWDKALVIIIIISTITLYAELF